MAIFSTESNIELSNTFESLLNRVASNMELILNTDIDRYSKLSGNQFEDLAFDIFVKESIGTPFENTLYHTADRDFPDIVAMDVFGVEVKATKKDDWTSIGNSILESSRVQSVEKIYILFGKLGGIPQVKYRDYESCLKGISVTHYPRYQIDMQLPEGESIFEKIGIPYDTLRKKDNPVSSIRNYYKSKLNQGESLWWIGDKEDDIKTFSPIIKNYANLSITEKKLIKADLMIMFPVIFSPRSTSKYKDIPAYLASRHGVVCSNIRDIFSAGGRETIIYNNIEIDVPQVVLNMLESKKEILSIFSNISEELLSEYWHNRNINTPPINEWLDQIHLEIGPLFMDQYTYISIREVFNNWRVSCKQ